MDQHVLFFNGIDADSGRYLRQPQTVHLPLREVAPKRDARYDVQLRNLAETGWGIVFAQGYGQESEIRVAMKPLLDRRRAQASHIEEQRYQEYTGERGYLPGDSKQSFLERQGVGPGPIDPKRLPYYLLIVGGPETIPYSFQYQLDVPCAVGRICFEKIEEYARYADSVVEAETRPARRPRRTALFGANHDPATEISLGELLEPLGHELRKWRDWDVTTVFAEEATKDRLGDLLGGQDAPSLLFTAGHGVGFGCGHERQKGCQGALLCQDWPGQGRASTNHYFMADDLNGASGLSGMISFHFACYSAGTPSHDDFSRSDRPRICPEPFVARLPQRMLAHPEGGALAVVGHVDQACQSSFLWRRAGSQVNAFADALFRLQDAFPIGAALEPLSRRYTEISADLFAVQDSVDVGIGDEEEAKFLRIACRDARNYVILGDPAVSLPAAAPPPRVIRGG